MSSVGLVKFVLLKLLRVAKKQVERIRIPNISICPTSAHYYQSSIDGFVSSRRHTANAYHLQTNEHNGKVSEKARKRIELALSWLLYLAKPKYISEGDTGKRFHFKINFITLTLPSEQKHSDQEITSKCLGNFLDVLKLKCKLEHYLWRAEAQSNGRIHFHLVTDKYIHYESIRKWWNQSTEILGYVSEFEKKIGHRNPNSTDVHSVKHVKRLASYLSKYMCKNRAFGCIGELRRVGGVYKNLSYSLPIIDKESLEITGWIQKTERALVGGEVIEVLYGSKQYQSESADKKKGKVIGYVLGGLIRPIESRLWFCSRSLSSLKKLKVAGCDYEFTAIDELVSKVDARVYNGEFVCSLYGDFSSVCSEVIRIQSLASLGQ